VLCVPVDHPFAARGRVSLADLAGHAVVSREAGSQTRVLFEAACAAHGVAPGRFIEVPTREAVKEAAAAGLGLGVVLDRETGEDRRLATVEIADIGLKAGTYVVCLEETRYLPAVNAYFDVCAALYPGEDVDASVSLTSSE
jgi:DNA-binding transcriptional LysR family regulator